MASTAQSAQQSKLRINTASGTALTITGVTQANPAVVSFTGTDPTAGDIVQVDSIVGMTELNGRAFAVDNVVASTSFELRGTDSTNYDAYSSGGTATPKTMTKIGNVKDFDIQQDEAAEIQRTNLDSTRQEFGIGLAGSWTMTANYDIDTADPGQAELEVAQDDGLSRVITLELASGKVFAGVGFVKSTSASGSAGADVSGSLNLRGTGQPTWFR